MRALCRRQPCKSEFENLLEHPAISLVSVLPSGQRIVNTGSTGLCGTDLRWKALHT